MRLRRWTAAVLLLLVLAGCAAPKEKADGSDQPALPVLSGADESLPDLPETGPAEPTPGSSFPASTQNDLVGPETEAAAPTTEPTEESQPAEPTEPAEPAETDRPVPSEAENQPLAPPETEPASAGPAVPEPDRPTVLSLGLYDGPFPEDGTGEAVDSVAVILVENPSDTQLQFAELHYQIDGREALFRVSELPPGARALVVEQNRLIATPASVWEAETAEDTAVYLASAPEERLTLRCDADGAVTVINQGTERAAFDLIYKQKNDEGIFVGGIAYHLRIEALAPGETRTLEAPHYSAADSVPVRVTVTPQG